MFRKNYTVKINLPGGIVAAGDLYAIVQIVVPAAAGDAERKLYQQLAETSAFDPRGHFVEGGHAH